MRDESPSGAAHPHVDPLPQRHLSEGGGIGGRIKVRPEDFVVDELPLYDPAGEGEHLYLGVEKIGVSHSELIGTLCRHLGVSRRTIGFAGMKDKHGVTRQTISVHTPQDVPAKPLGHDRIRIVWSQRHGNKLRRGHLAGNRFSIRIRDVEPTVVPRVAQAVARLERTGMPCYFGAQRFGYRRNNHVIGAMVVREDWTGALDELLGTTGSPYPEYQQRRRELYDAGQYAEAAREWTTADRSELIAIRALAGGRPASDAFLSIGQTAVSFWVNALQSAAFNRVLDRRLEAGTLATLHEGDLAWRHDSRAVFAVTADELAGDALSTRLHALEISPSGPMWGAKMTRADGAVDGVETDALATVGVSIDELVASKRGPVGGRRPLRVPLRHAEVDGGSDEHGPYIRLAFDLPRGAYATVVLREIMQNDVEGEEGD